MQVLYVVNFDVQGGDAYDRVLGHVAEWLSDAEGSLTVDSFRRAGSQLLRTAYVGEEAVTRHGVWDVIHNGADRALRLTVAQAAGTGLELTTRVTVTELAGETHFRVGIGRENTSQRLVPVAETDVYQPHIVRALTFDPELTLRTHGQLVSAEYIPIRTADEAREVADNLSRTNRLPLVMVHARTPDTWELARTLSRKLLGLARIVSVNFEASRVISAVHPGVKVPFGGLLLVWPGMSAESMSLTAELISELGAEHILRVLTRRLGSLSALGNGTDALWQHARSAADKARMRVLLERAALAREGGDLQGEIAALKQQVEMLSTTIAELEAIGEDAMQTADTKARLLRDAENELDLARHEAKTWRELYQGLGSPTLSEEPEDPWDAIPVLVSKSDPDATFLAISDAASEHIVFTERARKSWESIEYPEPDDMTEKLISLARAAVELYAGEPGRLPKLDTWFKEQYGLNVAMTDQTISDWKKKEFKWLNAFEHEDETLNATPHVKVRDGVKLNECGRIHFALEPKKKRIVVQHVAVKTYGK